MSDYIFIKRQFVGWLQCNDCTANVTERTTGRSTAISFHIYDSSNCTMLQKRALALTWKETQLFTNELNPYSWQRLFSSIFALFNMNHTQAWLPDRCIQEATREGIKAAKEDHYAIKCQILWGYLQQCQLRERKSFALVTIYRQREVYTFFHKQISSLVYKTKWAEVSFIEEAREYI